MGQEDLVEELSDAATDRDDEVGELLAAAADRIDQQRSRIDEREARLEELRTELEETNEGMVALTVELQAAEKRYRTLFEDAVEGIYKTDPDGCEYVMVNSSMAEILGYDSPEALRRAVDDVREDVFVDADRFEEYRDRLAAENRVENFEYRVRRADGEVRWVSDNARLLTDDEQSGFRGGVIDVTEVKEYERQLETLTEELEALNRVLRHDIANDIQVVRGFADHLQSVVAPEHRDLAGRIVTTSNHILDLTEDARHLVETLTGDEEGELEPRRLPEMISYVVERARDAHPDAEYVVADVPDVSVRANEMLSSVFRNLLTNGVVHNDADDPKVEVGGEVRDGTVRIRVSDNGSGIDPDVRDRIFEKGEQGIDSEGTGIGLYLVSAIVDSYGGDVWVEDRDQREPDAAGPAGCTFVVELPVAE